MIKIFHFWFILKAFPNLISKNILGVSKNTVNKTLAGPNKSKGKVI